MNGQTSTDTRPQFSVVIPCRNEEENVRGIAAAVIAQMEALGESFDLIFIDNASRDRTVPLVREMCAADPRIKLIVNTRDFGQMRSPTHAIFQAPGKVIINLCADFQDPPEMIPHFVERWRAGADIVLGVRQSEKTSAGLGWARRFSYWFAATFGDFPIIPNATGFGLYDGKVVRAIARINEPEPFFRGMLVETGYTVETLPYIRPERAGGVSNNNFFSLFAFALSSFAGASKKLLKMPIFIGAFIAMLAGAAFLAGLLALLLGYSAVWWFVGAGLELQIAIMFLFLGLLGDQARLQAERTRATPLVVERERINFTDAP